MHKKAELVGPLDAKARKKVIDVVRGPGDPPFFSVGPLTASVRVRPDETLIFAIYPPDFPKLSRPMLVIEDSPDPDTAKFGRLAAAYLGGPHPLRAYTMDATSRGLVERILDLARRDAIATFAFRAARDVPITSRGQSDQLEQRKRDLERELAGQVGATGKLVELVANAPSAGTATTLGELEAPVAPVVSPSSSTKP